jgi:hypothetical protein
VATDKDRITVYLPSELREKLAKMAERDKRSVSATIEILLSEALKARGED